MFFSAVFPRFYVVLHRRGRMGGLGAKVGNGCVEFEDNDGGVLG